MNRRQLVILLVTMPLLVLVGAAVAVAWSASQDDESWLSGSCGEAIYELTVDDEDEALEVNFELTSAAPGEEWQLQIQHNDGVLLDGARTTDEDAEIAVDVDVASDGDDEFIVVATPPDGEPCTAELRHG